jgi:hypothetical protein
MAKTKKAVRKSPAQPKEAPIKRSVLRVLILTFVSFGLYSLYWFYVTRQQLNEQLGEKASLKNISPIWQVLGPSLVFLVAIPLVLILVGLLLFPVAIALSIAVWYYLIKDLNQIRESVKLETTPPALYILGYVILSFMSPFNLALIGLLAYQLNEAWDKRLKGKAKEAPYTAGEIIVSASGVALFLIFFFGIIVLSIVGAATQQ